MRKKKPSSASRKPLKRSVNPPKSTRIGRGLVAGMRQVLAHVRGEIELPSYTPVDVKAIREKIGMTQTEFAQTFSLNLRTVQQWEQGKAAPDVAVRAYLTVIERNPQAVVTALSA